MVSVYKSEIFTKNYENNKYFIIFCLNKVFDINIIRKIYEYYIEYATGFALFKQKQYIINNKFIYTNEENDNNYYTGHAMQPIIKFLSLYHKNITDTKFCKILENINNIPNNQTIDFTECLTYLMSVKQLRKYFNPNRTADYVELLSGINQYVTKIDIWECSSICYICKKDKTNKYKTVKNKNIYFIYPINNETLDNLIIKQSQYKINISREIYYTKMLIKNNNILTIYISRINCKNGQIIFEKNNIKISKILDLPDFVFETNKEIYELIGIVIYDNDERNYTMIIKQNNKYLHYLNSHIIETDDEYFNIVASYNSTMLFYKIL
jgi:hypothetical protein